jgi:beta-N-acetylhexosaminidase
VAAGCDLLLLCAHLTETDRALGLARELERAEAAGGREAELIAASRERVERLLAGAPQHAVRELDATVLRAHGSEVSRIA